MKQIDKKTTRELLLEAVGVGEQIKNELAQIKRQNDYLEQVLQAAEDSLLKER